MLILKSFGRLAIRTYLFRFSTEKQKVQKNENTGTQYTNWVLARASGHNHNISHLKRKQIKDRYSIHRLTNLQFMCKIIKQANKYSLTMNENIVLLAHMNHVIKVVGKDISLYRFYMNLLLSKIYAQIKDPPDLICIGTLMSSLISMDLMKQEYWLGLMDEILVNKYDQEYDQLFGMIVGLNRYKEAVITQWNDYLMISSDEVIPKIPIIYRNSLNVLRQFVTYNIYNLKQCRLLFEALYQANINERFFWDSVRDWFNIYTKQQLNKKDMDQYFIMNQSAVQKVLHDHGIIRPRPILQQLCSIVFILSQFGNISWRFIQFAQDLIIYSINNGSNLYKKYQQISLEQQKRFSEQPAININQHIKTSNQSQKQNIQNMQKKYRTVFINPISLKNNFIIYFLAVLSRAYKKYNWPASKQIQKDDEETNLYDKKNEVVLDIRVKRWLLLQLVKPQMQYNTKQLLIIYRCKQFLEDFKIDVIQLMIEKLKNLRSTNATYDQIVQLMNILTKNNYNKMINIFRDFLMRNHPSEIYKLTKLLQNRNEFPYISQYLLRLPTAVNNHEKYFSFQQNCYFMLMLLQNSEGINIVQCSPDVRMQYDNQLEMLKQSLKIITYTRGFKISVNSYFHQILDYIDPVQFFEGGRG